MWSDNESPIDLLRFTYLTDAVVQLVQTETLLPTTIGIFGDWGSGKSTILQHAERRLNSLEDGTVCLTFNGWLFEGYEDAKSALMGNILEGLEKHLKDHRNLTDAAASQITALLKRVNWLKAAKLAAGLALPLVAGVPLVAAIPGLTPSAEKG